MTPTLRDELEEIINSHDRLLSTPGKSNPYANISSTLDMHEELILRIADRFEELKDRIT